MSKQRFVVCVVAACVVAWLANSSAAMSTQPTQPPDNCRKGISDRDPLLYGGEMRDGLLILRVAYDPDVEPEHQKAFEGAMELWNAKSPTTRVKFEWTTSEIVDLRLQRGAPIYTEQEDINSDVLKIDEARIDKAEQTKCAEYVPSGPYIWYSLKIMNWMTQPTEWPNQTIEQLMKTDPEFVGMATIYAHELGHVLNIRHKPGESVMHENANETCKKLGMSILAPIQPDDTSDARRCFWGARDKLREPGAVRRPYRPPSK